MPPVTRPRRRVLELRGGATAWLQLNILRAVVLAAAPLGQRGVHRVAWRLAGLFDARNAAVVDLGFGRVRVPLGDGYAVKLLSPGYRYEPEVEPIVRAAMEHGCSFIDGGANLGYWSVLASSLCDQAQRVVAVEPVPELFDLLQDNAELNGGRFLCQRAALWSEAGAELTMVSHHQRHAGSSAVHGAEKVGHDGYYATTTPTVTIDSIVARYCRDDRPLLVKLDVEGAESAALSGARETLAGRDTIVLYEDHGSDVEHRSTRYMIEELGFRVFACSEAGPREVTAMADVARCKTDTVHGFNFVAFHPGSSVGPEVIGF